MTVFNQNFDITQGDSKRIVIPVVDENNAPFNLAGTTVRWVLSRGPGTSPLLQKQSPGGIDIGPTSFTVKLDPSDTLLMRGKFYHEAEITEADGSISTVTIGMATIRGGV